MPTVKVATTLTHKYLKSKKKYILKNFERVLLNPKHKKMQKKTIFPKKTVVSNLPKINKFSKIS